MTDVEPTLQLVETAPAKQEKSIRQQYELLSIKLDEVLALIAQRRKRRAQV